MENFQHRTSRSMRRFNLDVFDGTFFSCISNLIRYDIIHRIYDCLWHIFIDHFGKSWRFFFSLLLFWFIREHYNRLDSRASSMLSIKPSFPLFSTSTTTQWRWLKVCNDWLLFAFNTLLNFIIFGLIDCVFVYFTHFWLFFSLLCIRDWFEYHTTINGVYYREINHFRMKLQHNVILSKCVCVWKCDCKTTNITDPQ